jgi:hypothetical protein
MSHSEQRSLVTDRSLIRLASISQLHAVFIKLCKVSSTRVSLLVGTDEVQDMVEIDGGDTLEHQLLGEDVRFFNQCR